MLEYIIKYLVTRLTAVFPDIEIKGLCELIQGPEDRSIVFPAEYCANNEYKQIDYDFGKGLIYFRKNGKVTNAKLSSEQELYGGDPYERQTYPLRLVCFLPKDFYNTDNNFIEEKIAENIKRAITFVNDKAVRLALKAENVSTIVNSYTTDRNEVIKQEYKNVEVKVNFDKLYIAIDFDLVIEASQKCFSYWSCNDEAADIAFCKPVKIYNTLNELLGTEPSGGRFTAPDAEIKKYDGTHFFNVPSGGTETLDPVIIFEPDGVTEIARKSPGQDYITEECPVCPTLNELVASSTDSQVVSAIDLAGKDNSVLPGVLGLNTEEQIRAAMVFNTTLDDFIQALSDTDLLSLTEEQITYLIGTFDAAEIVQLSASQVQMLVDAQLEQLSTAQLNHVTTILTSTQIHLLSATQVQMLNSTQVGYLSASQIQQLSNGQLINLSTAQLNYIVTILTSTQVQLLSNAQLLLLSSAQALYVFRAYLDPLSSANLLIQLRDTLTHKNRITDTVAPGITFTEANYLTGAMRVHASLAIQTNNNHL